MAATMKPSCSFARVAMILWLLVAIVGFLSTVVAEDYASSTTVHAADGAAADDIAPTPVAIKSELPACTSDTQSKMTQFSLRNIELQRRCFDQSGGVNAFPFDAAPSRSQLVRLSTSAACIFVSKAVLRVIERECVLGEMMPVRATAETILKLNEDRKTLAKTPTTPEDELQRQIQERALMNHARDENPIDFSPGQYPPEMQQYEIQLTKAYATGGIILLSSDLKVLNDISATEQTGSEAAFAAVAELGESSSSTGHSSTSGSSLPTSQEDFVAGSEHEDIAHPGSHGSFRDEASTSTPPNSGSPVDGSTKPPAASSPASLSYRSNPSWLTAAIVIFCTLRVGGVV